MGNSHDRIDVMPQRMALLEEIKLDLFFNELSLDGVEKINIEATIALTKVYRALRNYNITTCRIGAEDYQKLFQMIQNMPDSFNITNFFFSFFRTPYESESVEKEQDEYLTHDWFIDDRKCTGFALASILNSAGLSIYSAVWDVPFIHLRKDSLDTLARNICTEKHVDIHIPQIQLDEEPELIESSLLIADKKISLRNDHGMDVLMDFSKRLLKCPYVIGVVNSLPFNPHERKFIKEVRNNGLIEIVLPWTDEGYGIVVRTTGRNLQETVKISEIIDERYGGL